MGISARITSVSAMGRSAARSSSSPTQRRSTSGASSTGVPDRDAAMRPPAALLPRRPFRVVTGRRAPAAAAAAKTPMLTQMTVAAPPSLRMPTAGMAKSRAESEASSPSRALRVARSGSTVSVPVPGSSMRTTGIP